MKTVEVQGGCDCGGKVNLDVEAVSPREVVDRRVNTADVDAGLRLITCVLCEEVCEVAQGYSLFQSVVVKWVSSVEARNKTMRRCQVRRDVFRETCCEMT